MNSTFDPDTGGQHSQTSGDPTSRGNYVESLTLDPDAGARGSRLSDDPISGDDLRNSTLDPDAGGKHSQMTDDPTSGGGDLKYPASDPDAGVGTPQLLDDPGRSDQASLCFKVERCIAVTNKTEEKTRTAKFKVTPATSRRATRRARNQASTNPPEGDTRNSPLGVEQVPPTNDQTSPTVIVRKEGNDEDRPRCTPSKEVV